jgi:hypothetical protein
MQANGDDAGAFEFVRATNQCTFEAMSNMKLSYWRELWDAVSSQHAAVPRLWKAAFGSESCSRVVSHRGWNKIIWQHDCHTGWILYRTVLILVFAVGDGCVFTAYGTVSEPIPETRAVFDLQDTH